MNQQQLNQLELSAIIAFLEVAERGSFTEAATYLNLSQPTVSQQVQRLERSVGAQLLRRRSNGISLTDEGAIFIEHCRTCLQALQNGLRAIAQFSETISGQVTLGLTPSVAQRYLPGILTFYYEQYPGVSLRIVEDFLNELIEGLKQQRIDLAVLSLPIPAEHFEISVLYQEPLVLAVAPEHSLATVEQVTWDMLSQQPIILPRQHSDFGVRYIIEELYRRHHASMEVAAEVSGFRSLRQLILSNFGVTILPQSLVQQDVQDGKLVAKDLTDFELMHTVALVNCRQQRLSLAAEKLAEVIHRCTAAKADRLE
ncbi:MAG: hydrogen peroxide-inducible genes activator [Elainellaceae cyanobacterium]